MFFFAELCVLAPLRENWFSLSIGSRKDAKKNRKVGPIVRANNPNRRRRFALPAHSKLSPQPLLQFAESLNNFFLDKMLTFRDYRFSADYDFAHGRA